MIRAAFFDIDGTLLSHKTLQVTQATIDAVKKLRQAGILCIVATGRHRTELEKLPLDELEFDGYLTLNGQLLLDGRKNARYGVPITGSAKELLLSLFENHTLPVLLLEQDRIYLNYVDAGVEQAQAAISTSVPEISDYAGAELYQACLYLPEDGHPCLEMLQEQCVVTWWHSCGVDIVAKGGGKVAGIRRFLEETGIKREETIAFGDGHNDLEMLKFAGIGVAMGNGTEEVKQAADYVTASVDEDGVVKALTHFGLI